LASSPTSCDWRRLDERIEVVSTQIEALAQQDDSSRRLMTVPGVGPIISSAVVAAIGNGAGFKQGRDFGAWLGLVPKQERKSVAPMPAPFHRY
jgi:transposase